MSTNTESAMIRVIRSSLDDWKNGHEGWDLPPTLFREIGMLAHEDIDAARALAWEIVRSGKDNVISFSPKVFLPLTHLCRDYCGYCTFRKEPDETKDLYMTVDDVIRVVKTGEKAGCKEALFTLGERPELKYQEAKEWLAGNGYRTTLEYLKHVSEVVSSETTLFPHVNPGTMSYREINGFKSSNVSMGLMLESTSELLHQKGMPHEYAPSKRPAARMKTLQNAGKLRVPFTTGLLIGLGESWLDVLRGIAAIKELNDEFGHIQEVIIQNFRAKRNTPMGGCKDPSEQYLSWCLVCARIILGPEINIQVPPNLSPGSYQNYLKDGINDWGGISPVTVDYVNPEAKWPTIKALAETCSEENLVLKARFPVYPEFIDPDKGFIEESLYDKVKTQSDDDGYVKGGLGQYGV